MNCNYDIGKLPRPLRHNLRCATSPKGRGLGRTGNFLSSPEAPSQRELASLKGLTEGVLRFLSFFLLFRLIGDLTGLDGGKHLAVELCTVKGGVVALRVQLFLFHRVGGVQIHQHKVGIEARLQLTLGKT